MDSNDLRAFMRAGAITAELIHLEAHTPTVEDAARALGVPAAQVAKSILFLAGDAPVLVIAAGVSRIDYRRLADQLGLSRKKLRMATPEEVLTLAGFVVGAMPPFGHKLPLRTLLDARLFDQAEVYAGGGDLNAMLRVAPPEIARVTGGSRVDVSLASS
jgi:prolyl-tRNA editing enzyme YbaK/EbsC (Cys-tRNA(Pro) deacylase)